LLPPARDLDAATEVRGAGTPDSRCQAEFLARSEPLVVAGDFNSNTVLDRRGARHTQSAMVSRLEAFGVFSAYHAHYREDQGRESRPTFYMYRHADKPFHLDYVFLPNAWRHAFRHVEVGDFERWEKHSDHMPVTATLFTMAPKMVGNVSAAAGSVLARG
jgi:endonuclease/exonuclease/phosphatase family metal-dependent hydrolase